MFKDFGKKTKQFHGFPSLNFGMNNEAYGFSGLITDFDARYGLNTQTDLAAISYWYDKMKNNVYAAQATAANQPRLIVSDADFNNLPSVDFFDTARYMTLSKEISSSNVTVALVCKMTAIIFHNRILVSDLGYNVSTGGTTANVTGIGVYATTGASTFDTTIENTNPHISILSIYNGGHIIVDGNTEITGQTPPSGASNFNLIGSSNTAATVRGKISRILVFERLFTADECLTLSNNINTDYAIY